MSSERTVNNEGNRRRAATVVLVATATPMILGFAALVIDVGVLYNTKADLQRAADAAALAAAGALTPETPESEIRQRAKDIVEQNPVLGRSVTIDAARDLVLGRANYDVQANQYNFTAQSFLPDAVRVTVRCTEDSPNGPVDLFFASIFGRTYTNVAASAAATLIPRDIAVVADLSRSHNYDSTFRNLNVTDINLYDVWAAFPGGIGDGAGSTWDHLSDDDVAGLDDDQLAQMAGPAWGLLKQLGYGTLEVTSNYDPNADPGLVKLRRSRDWSNSTVNQFLSSQGYTSQEINAINSDRYDGSSTSYRRRVAIALGLAEWHSGLPGGRWQQLGIPPSQTGDGDQRFESDELNCVARFGDRTMAESAQIWDNYIQERMGSAWGGSNDPVDLDDRYGVKTFIDYLMNNRATHDDTPELADTPHQPMESVRNAVDEFVRTLESVRSNDQVSLEVYSTRGRHEINLTTDFQLVSERLADMQAGHYEPLTNMGAGILRAVEELTGERTNPLARKVMILLTDGQANVACETCTRIDYNGGKAYARRMARYAVENGIQIFTVGVGAGADRDLLGDIAEMGGGTYFHAEGSIEDYTEELGEIFRILGGAQPVALIE